MFRSLIYFCGLISIVKCGEDLCKNGAQLDSIAYINPNKMYFFTSGGFYWFLGPDKFPPEENGLPLPAGFQRGDAAIFRNTLEGCANSNNPKGPEEQEILLIEFINGQNMVLIYDIRKDKWADNPVSYSQVDDLRPANIDWNKPIDSAFSYENKYFVVIQGDIYSVVDISSLCDPNGSAKGRNNQPISDLNMVGKISATSGLDGFSGFYLFQNDLFWKIKIKSIDLNQGKITTVKTVGHDIATKFFRFPSGCHFDNSGTDVTVVPTDDVSESSGPSSTSNLSDISEESIGSIHSWNFIIIFAVIIAVIVIVIIGLIGFLVKNSKDKQSLKLGSTVTTNESEVENLNYKFVAKANKKGKSKVASDIARSQLDTQNKSDPKEKSEGWSTFSLKT